MKNNEKINIIYQLLKLAKIDGYISEDEHSLVHKIAKFTGVDKLDIEQIIAEKPDYNPPKEEFDRVFQFQQLALLMMVDGKVTDEEIQYCKDFGMKAALHPAATNEVINKLISNKGKPLLPSEILAIFNQYYN